MRAVRFLSVAAIAAVTGCAGAPAKQAPSEFRVRDAGVEWVALEFPPAGNGGGYVVQRKTGDGAWESIADVDAGKGTYRDAWLKPGSSYSYRLAETDERATRVIRGGEEAVPFRVDLSGVKRMTLIATDGGDGNGNDHAVWGSPVLVKADGTKVRLAALKPKSFRVGWGNPGEPRTIGIGTTRYENSIWAHAWSEMVHELDDEYSAFEAMVGVDEGQGKKGSVGFKVRLLTDRFSEEVSLALPPLKGSPGRTAYYVDAESGDDGADGKSMETPWKSLKRVNLMEFEPGDRILFKAGSRYAGQLKPHGSGSKEEPIVMDRYGGEDLPRIDGRGEVKATVHLSGVEYWRVNNLEVTNTGEEREPGRTGVRVDGYDCGVMHDIRLTGLFIHDVNGSNVKSRGGGVGIGWSNGGSGKISYFDGLLIENCRLVRCDRNGIAGGGYWDRNNWHPSRNVVIRGNLLEDIGGDGIVPIGCDGALVEHNVLKGGRTRAEDYAAGIWPWACDNTLVQFNEVSGMRGTKDGQGFDSDYNCRNSIFQYNYSHDNDGGFMLICDADEKGYSVGNIGTIVRYNISRNDGERIFQLAGPTKNTTIHNNVIYVREGLDVLGIYHNNWNGWSDGVEFRNNIFYAAGKMRHEYGKSTNNSYSNNVFFGNHENPPADANGIAVDPMLVKPGGGGDGRDSLAGYMLKAGSPLIGAGHPIENNPGRDFWGNAVPGPDGKLSVGAHERD